ncbi:hypothetical protein ABT127_37205 [Streptomyces sp. NPDC001904]|uniref:hypothetical protein n=1 Tax=Streptomyces sp. NPDC001904 TaxID=3154531 RepID=UPI0033229A54
MRSRNVRIVVGAAAAVAALAVSGCSGDDGGSDKGAGASSSAAPDASASDSASGSGSDSGSGSAKDAVGIWSATTDGKPVVLVIGGRQASLSTGDGHLCTGTVTGSGTRTLSLTCADGSTDRTAGTIESNDGSTMKVSWKAGTQDTFKKSANGQLPTDLPTSLPSGLPTG